MTTAASASVLRQMRHGAKNALHTAASLLNLAETYPQALGRQGTGAHARRLLAVASVFDHLVVAVGESGGETLLVDSLAALSALAKRCKAALTAPALDAGQAAGQGASPGPAMLTLERAVALGLYAAEQHQEIQAMRQGLDAMLPVQWRLSVNPGTALLRIGLPPPAPAAWKQEPDANFEREIIRLTCSTLGGRYERERDRAMSILEYPLEQSCHFLFRNP